MVGPSATIYLEIMHSRNLGGSCWRSAVEPQNAINRYTVVVKRNAVVNVLLLHAADLSKYLFYYYSLCS